MRIENTNQFAQNAKTIETSKPTRTDVDREFAQQIKMKEPAVKGVNFPQVANREIMKDYAEYYFKAGKSYEDAKNYKSAISAYERSNSASPDISKAQSVVGARRKEYQG